MVENNKLIIELELLKEEVARIKKDMSDTNVSKLIVEANDAINSIYTLRDDNIKLQNQLSISVDNATKDIISKLDEKYISKSNLKDLNKNIFSYKSKLSSAMNELHVTNREIKQDLFEQVEEYFETGITRKEVEDNYVTKEEFNKYSNFINDRYNYLLNKIDFITEEMRNKIDISNINSAINDVKSILIDELEINKLVTKDELANKLKAYIEKLDYVMMFDNLRRLAQNNKSKIVNIEKELPKIAIPLVEIVSDNTYSARDIDIKLTKYATLEDLYSYLSNVYGTTTVDEMISKLVDKEEINKLNNKLNKDIEDMTIRVNSLDTKYREAAKTIENLQIIIEGKDSKIREITNKLNELEAISTIKSKSEDSAIFQEINNMKTKIQDIEDIVIVNNDWEV